MEPELWERVQELCVAALERDEERRAAFVEDACAGNDVLRQEVESLLAQQSHAANFMEVPALEQAAKAGAVSSATEEDSQLIGQMISHYRITGLLGSGGMGEVYRAVRADGAYEKEVAVKLIRRGLGSAYFASRFRNELQILARLDHPNIARLLDGGTTSDGQPYVVMEYVDGIAIDEYCSAGKLNLQDRLNLFRAVCDAVQYAHQHLVIHRDLKPGNILVTPDGEPKLLDFGIAKIIHPHQEEQAPGGTPMTILPMMTPEFASPEQVKNLPITTASDVYSLGVILYDLLVGRLPFAGQNSAPHEVARAICEADPEKPSSAIRSLRNERSKAQHGPQNAPPLNRLGESRTPGLGKALAGDLDNIVLKALQKEPARRYSSVEQFSADVRRFLDGLPVLAHKDSLRYRAGKFVRREKWIVTAVAVVILSLTAGMIATLREAHIAQLERAREQRRFNDVRALATSLTFDVYDAIQFLPGSTSARKLLVSKALSYLDSLSREASGDLSLQRQLAAAYERVGDVQGYFDAANLGDTAGALASYRKAAAIEESMLVADGHSKESRQNLSNIYQKLSQILSASGRYGAALDYAQRALSIEQELATTDSTALSEEGLAGSYYVLGLSQANMGHFQDALAVLRQSAGIREQIATTDAPLNAVVQTRLSGTYGEMSQIFAYVGDPAQAIRSAKSGLQVMGRLSASAPGNLVYREYVYEHEEAIGSYFEQEGDVMQAQNYYQKALTGFNATSAADTNDANAKLWLGVCETNLGKLQVVIGQTAAGLENIHKGLAIAIALYRGDPDENSDKLPDLADAYATSGWAHARLAMRPAISDAARISEWRQALADYHKSLDIWHDAQRLHVVAAFDAAKADETARAIAKCDAALAQACRHSTVACPSQNAPNG